LFMMILDLACLSTPKSTIGTAEAGISFVFLGFLKVI